MTNRIEEKRNGFEEKIGKTVFFLEAKSSDEAKGKPEEMLKKLIINELLSEDQALLPRKCGCSHVSDGCSRMH